MICPYIDTNGNTNKGGKADHETRKRRESSSSDECAVQVPPKKSKQELLPAFPTMDFEEIDITEEKKKEAIMMRNFKKVLYIVYAIRVCLLVNYTCFTLVFIYIVQRSCGILQKDLIIMLISMDKDIPHFLIPT